MTYALVTLIALLQIADAYLTLRLLEDGGRELNPVMDMLFDKLGMVPALVATKILAVIALILLAPYAPMEAYAVVAAFYVGVVVWNVRELLYRA